MYDEAHKRRSLESTYYDDFRKAWGNEEMSDEDYGWVLRAEVCDDKVIERYKLYEKHRKSLKEAPPKPTFPKVPEGYVHKPAPIPPELHGQRGYHLPPKQTTAEPPETETGKAEKELIAAAKKAKGKLGDLLKQFGVIKANKSLFTWSKCILTQDHFG